MSGLCTFKSSWPFFTLSSRRALMSTTRPLAIEMTGISRAISGKTVPVAVNSEADSTWPAEDSGNLATSSLSIVIRFMSATWITWAGGGAPSPFSLPLQQERGRHNAVARARANAALGDCLRNEVEIIGLPRVPQQDSVALRLSYTRRSIADRQVEPSGSRPVR